MTPQMRAVLLSLILLVMLAACGEPAYTPAPEVQATREAEEYQRAAERGQTVWHIGIGVLVVFCAILLVMSAYLANTTYRVKAADAQKAEAEARRLEFISLGDGKAYDTRHKTVIAAAGVASQLSPVMPAEALPAVTRQGEPLALFVLDAATIAGWASKTFPHWRKWPTDDNGNPTMTGETWYRNTNELVEMGLLDPKHEGKQTTVAGGHDLLWVHNQLT